MENKSEQKRKWVNSKLAEMTAGTHISNSARTKLMKKLWDEAKVRFD